MKARLNVFYGDITLSEIKEKQNQVKLIKSYFEENNDVMVVLHLTRMLNLGEEFTLCEFSNYAKEIITEIDSGKRDSAHNLIKNYEQYMIDLESLLNS